jgi:hypothetical protein
MPRDASGVVRKIELLMIANMIKTFAIKLRNTGARQT